MPHPSNFMDKPMDLAKDVARLGRIPLVVVLEFMALMAAGCAHEQKAKKAQPVIFKHCEFAQDADGTKGCVCLNPVVVKTLDAKTGKATTTAYCDGKVN